MDPTLVLGTRFEFQFQICVYEHVILRIYVIFFLTWWKRREIGESGGNKIDFFLK